MKDILSIYLRIFIHKSHQDVSLLTFEVILVASQRRRIDITLRNWASSGCLFACCSHQIGDHRKDPCAIHTAHVYYISIRID